VDEHLGLPVRNAGAALANCTSPWELVRTYGGHIAPIAEVSEEPKRQGRTDPIALLGHRMNNSKSKEKFKEAQKQLEEENAEQMDQLKNKLKWVGMLRFLFTVRTTNFVH
jgi:hypothetical protein